MKLVKMSSPGWEKEFDDADKLRIELLSYICCSCMLGDPDFDFKPVSDDATVDELLATACGCEFDVEW
jgi:hypothetical protein